MYVVYNDDGIIEMSTESQEAFDLNLNGRSYIVVDDDLDISHHKVVDGELVSDVALKQRADADATRSTRNALLRDTDWTQIPDSTADKAAWGAYRQALRDVPTQSGFPNDVNWPTKPTD